MRVLDTPGVYYERADAASGGIGSLRTDIAGMVGMAERGPLHLAVPVESYRQFQAWFGEPIDNAYLAYCARAFFENGGSRLWAVRVASDAASTAGVVLQASGQPAWRIEASSPGVWGNRLAVRVAEVHRAQVRAVADALLPDTLRVAASAGFSPYTLVELRQPGKPPGRAVVRAVDAVKAVLGLDRPLAGFELGKPLYLETVAYSIEVFESGRLIATAEDLSPVPEHPRYGPSVLRQAWQVVDPAMPEAEPFPASSEKAIQFFRAGRGAGRIAPPPIVIRELRDKAARDSLDLLSLPPNAMVPLTGGADGLAAIGVRDFIGEATTPFASDEAIAYGRRGLAALAPVEEVAVLAVPDIHIQPRIPRAILPPVCLPDPCLPAAPRVVPVAVQAVGDMPPLFDREAVYQVQAAQIAQCERRRDRIALLDAPFETSANAQLAASGLRAWRQRFDSPFAALYAPWLDVADPLRGGGSASGLRAIPPCGHVAGLIAATDLRRGVHVAPANVSLQWIQGLSLSINDELHGLLNAIGVNALRAQPGRGVRVLGARTMASDTDWRFLNVRRLVCMIGKALDRSLQWAVFEPNDWRLRAKLTLVVGSFLHALWTRGAMAGATPDEAFFVRCDESNNPQQSRELGELLLELGIAPTVPFEFIVLRVGRDANGFAVSESGSGQAEA